jgi:hypothetical protein
MSCVFILGITILNFKEFAMMDHYQIVLKPKHDNSSVKLKIAERVA